MSVDLFIRVGRISTLKTLVTFQRLQSASEYFNTNKWHFIIYVFLLCFGLFIKQMLLHICTSIFINSPKLLRDKSVVILCQKRRQTESGSCLSVSRSSAGLIEQLRMFSASTHECPSTVKTVAKTNSCVPSVLFTQYFPFFLSFSSLCKKKYELYYREWSDSAFSGVYSSIVKYWSVCDKMFFLTSDKFAFNSQNGQESTRVI